MTDYFSENYSLVGAKGLSSPDDTPYETPGYIRSKRSSRATAGSREQSVTPPPLPTDAAEVQEKARDGRYTALDPRRFTPTLHASLVSEILSLRRDLDSKNNLVENLETSLSAAKTENESLTEQVSRNAKDVKNAKLQVQQMEKGTYAALEDLVKERDLARSNLDDVKTKLEAAQKTARRQDEDAERTQRIWESEKERWDDERRQLERRVHVTESRLRTVVDEMNARQAATESQTIHMEDSEESMFKDSGFGNESDTASIHSATPKTHRRNRSSLSFRRGSIQNSRATGTPEPGPKPNSYNLADELGIDEEDEYDVDEFEHPDEEFEYSEHLRRTMESRQSSVAGELDSKAKRVLGLTTENIDSPTSPTFSHKPKLSIESTTLSDPGKHAVEQSQVLSPVAEIQRTPRMEYVDTGYQPSPPPSPPRDQKTPGGISVPKIEEPKAEVSGDVAADSRRPVQQMPRPGARASIPPISPPDTPVTKSLAWSDGKPSTSSGLPYTTASTQTDLVEVEAKAPRKHSSNKDSLSPPSFVPSIAIHPPGSRPSSPRPHVLPPGTKNASTQANLTGKSRDAAVQTKEIRVDRRPVKLPQHLLPSYLLPSPTFHEPPPPKELKRAGSGGMTKVSTKATQSTSVPPPPAPAPVPAPAPAQSPQESSPEPPRQDSQKDMRSVPLKAVSLPRPVLTPPEEQGEPIPDGPLNRSAQYGVTKPGQRASQLLDVDKDSDSSDGEDFVSDIDTKDLDNSIYALSKPPQGRFGLSEPPKAVPEDKEISPERRPDTAGSYGAAPAPSISSSQANSQSNAWNRPKAPVKLGSSYKDIRSRSPSLASSTYSSQSGAAPPFPIPTRSSSRPLPNSHSEGSQSPTQHLADKFSNRGSRHRSQSSQQASLRKVQSAAIIRQSNRRGSPQKARRRRRQSPDLTPVQSMAFESPPQPQLPVPELPTPLQGNPAFNYMGNSMDLSRAATAATNTPRASEETKLVDAIAGTMVGEWMWKYVRKRKSFGVQEDFPVGEDGTVNTTSHGTRHKRWVWLSPYERTIMWDTKQPSSGSALLGKKGRKLGIQSVLEVRDATPLPKGAELGTAHNLSILILTPARALKFTTTSSERHALWMTALSFLAQPAQLPSQIPPMPNLPQPPATPYEPPPIKRHRSPSFGRATVRDSIRLAKGRRPTMPKGGSQPDSGPGDAMMALEGPPSNDGAASPAVPRLYISTSRHKRERSNTTSSPRLPPALHGFRSFSSTAALPSTASSTLNPSSTNGSSLRPHLPSVSSKSGSRQESMLSPDRPNFFEAVGTVRMEAFVDPKGHDGVLYLPAPPAKARRGRGDSNLSEKTAEKQRAGYVFDENGFDPFKNF